MKVLLELSKENLEQIAQRVAEISNSSRINNQSFLTVNQCAEELNITGRTVINKINKGEIKTLAGKPYRIPSAQFQNQ